MGGERGRSRAAVFSAAADLFSERGYTRTSVRDIAQRAGVDPSLVIRHFGTKERLFVESLHVSDDDALQLQPPLDTLGERLVRFVMSTDQRLRSVYLGLVRASDTGEVGSVLRAMHEENFVAPLHRILEGADRELRARLLASMIGGLMYSLWTVEDAGLRDADPSAVIAAYAPALQSLITPPS